MATTAPSFPTDWQEQVTVALKKAREADPTKTIFGVTLPADWKHELAHFARSGEVGRLFGVRAVAFGGKSIVPFDAPKKEEAKPTKKVG